MSTKLYVVTAGNIIDGYNADVPNKVEIFSTPELAEAFGTLHDFHTVVEKILDPVVQLPTLG